MIPVILAVDPGEKRIGLAISEAETGIAAPVGIIAHSTLKIDAQKISQVALERKAGRIVIGAAYNDEGGHTLASKRSFHLAEYLKKEINIEVVLWDESFSTQDLSLDPWRSAGKKKKKKPQDDLAAVLILREYVESLRTRQIIQEEKPEDNEEKNGQLRG